MILQMKLSISEINKFLEIKMSSFTSALYSENLLALAIIVRHSN